MAGPGQPAAIVGLVNEWLLRALVLLRFMSHLVLVLLAGIRRRRSSGVRRTLLWLAYQLATWSAPSALSKLFLGNTSRDEQLHTFWMPILLVHLARPDNMSAYTLEDNVLAGRQLVDVPLQILGSSYALYKHIIVVGDAGTLLPASCIIFSLGIAKYVENAFALRKGNLGSIRSSIKKLHKNSRSIKGDGRSWEGLDNEGALLAAHSVFYISKGAFADYSFTKKPEMHPSSKVSSGGGWKYMCKVVEMELSLMYDIMYTKASRIHTWTGYIIRLASPLFIVVTLLLFFFRSTDGQKRADVIITYILLIGTLVLEVGWLIRAVVSTWTHAFLRDKGMVCSSWHSLRHYARALSPSRDPSSYRRWSGIIGQYNIFHETTHDTTNPSSAILKLIEMDDTAMEYQYSRGLKISSQIRELLFKQIWEIFNPVVPEKKKEEEEKIIKVLIDQLEPDHEAGFRWRRALDKALEFAPEFQENVLTWHIATHVFLLCPEFEADMNNNHEYVKAIKVLSNYMMFLVVVRPNMLPGLKLGSLHDTTSDALKEIWKKSGSPSCRVLAEKWMQNNMDSMGQKSAILKDGTLYAKLMLKRLSSITSWSEVFKHFPNEDKSIKQFIGLLRLSYPPIDNQLPVKEMLDLIWNSWVRLLIYASIRCDRNSHAKQLSRGGELTTIVWMLAEHAGIYRIPVNN